MSKARGVGIVVATSVALVLLSITTLAVGQSNNKCCVPARVDPPQDPGGCTADDQTKSCDIGSCNGQASEVAVPGHCEDERGKNCNLGTGARRIRWGIWDCDENAYPNCSCVFRTFSTITVPVEDCSGDPCSNN